MKLRLDFKTRVIAPPERARHRNMRIISSPPSLPYRFHCTQNARLRVLLQRLPGGDVADSGASDIDLYAPEAPRPGLGLSHK